MFKRNEGLLDRSVRVAVGMVLLPAGLFWIGGLQGNVPGLVAAGLGAWVLITGLTGICPLYLPFGISTLEKENEFIAKIKSMAVSCRAGGTACTGQSCWPGPRSAGDTPSEQGQTAQG